MMLFPKPVKREKKRKRLKAGGKKTDSWKEVLAELKVRFERAGITSCELRLDGCWRNNALSFAHSKKRRKIEEGELTETCLLCVPCHQKIEFRKDMTEIVRGVINQRKVKI